MPRPPARLLPLLALPACVLAGCGGANASKQAASTPTPAEPRTASGCEKVQAPPPKTVKLPKPATELDPAKRYVATVSTSCGDFQITLDAKRAPRTGGSFKYLADKRVFDNTTFHRVSPGFVIQGGDPQGKGSGGPGYSIVEAPPNDIQYVKGVVAMAKTALEAPGTSGSQFFVVTGEAPPPLPPEYALLGKLSGGQTAVDKIAASEVDKSTEQPLDPIVIRSIKVTEG
jgi:cyclophilin family peptidyl-prolyl cis-trans isomerase